VRVFLDTNVLVAAFATRGLCADLLRAVLAEHELLVGEVILEELERVLHRKLKVPDKIVTEVLELLRGQTVVPRPLAPAAIELSDPDDLWVLASAVASNADALVTGDRGLLEAADRATVRILSPRAFWTLLKDAPRK